MSKESRDVRDPFGLAVDAGKLEGWEDAAVLRSVVVDPRWKEGKKRGMASQADLVLVKPGKGIAIVECKLKTGEAKHGMLEQVLMYGEMANDLGADELGNRLAMAEPGKGCRKYPESFIRDTVSGMTGRQSIHHITVLDRWGRSTLPNTVGRTLKRLNAALAAVNVPEIEVLTIENDIRRVNLSKGDAESGDE